MLFDDLRLADHPMRRLRCVTSAEPAVDRSRLQGLTWRRRARTMLRAGGRIAGAQVASTAAPEVLCERPLDHFRTGKLGRAPRVQAPLSKAWPPTRSASRSRRTAPTT